jgi:hypothetical protein
LKQTKEVIDPLLIFEQRPKRQLLKTEVSKNGQSISWKNQNR